jgi:hypothetical protein
LDETHAPITPFNAIGVVTSAINGHLVAAPDQPGAEFLNKGLKPTVPGGDARVPIKAIRKDDVLVSARAFDYRPPPA